MKRFIYSAIAVMLMVCGCQYHPFYDGQPLRLYATDHGIIDYSDQSLMEPGNNHIYVPIVMNSRVQVVGLAAGAQSGSNASCCSCVSGSSARKSTAPASYSAQPVSGVEA